MEMSHNRTYERKQRDEPEPCQHRNLQPRRRYGREQEDPQTNSQREPDQGLDERLRSLIAPDEPGPVGDRKILEPSLQRLSSEHPLHDDTALFQQPNERIRPARGTKVKTIQVAVSRRLEPCCGTRLPGHRHRRKRAIKSRYEKRSWLARPHRDAIACNHKQRRPEEPVEGYTRPTTWKGRWIMNTPGEHGESAHFREATRAAPASLG